MSEDELIEENEVARFYRNSSTRSLQSYASSIGLKCFIAERKDGSKKEYVIVDKKGTVIKTSASYESICCFIDVRKRLAKR